MVVSILMFFLRMCKMRWQNIGYYVGPIILATTPIMIALWANLVLTIYFSVMSLWPLFEPARDYFMTELMPSVMPNFNATQELKCWMIHGMCTKV